MFKKINPIINSLALEAVEAAERFFTAPGVGAVKKDFAINYIISRIPLPVYLIPFKPIILMVLNKTIDFAIEEAVECLNNMKKKLSD